MRVRHRRPWDGSAVYLADAQGAEPGDSGRSLRHSLQTWAADPAAMATVQGLYGWERRGDHVQALISRTWTSSRA